MLTKPEISILVPFFGNFDYRRLEMVIKSVQLQSKKGVEFLICNGREAFEIEEINSSQLDIKNILYSISKKIDSKQDFPRGLVYNIGIEKSKGKYLYLSDADILFANDFFEKLIEFSNKMQVPMKRPMMRRLLLQDFEKFYSIYSEDGIQRALNKLDFSQEFIVKPDKNLRELKVIKKWENGRMKTFIATENDFKEYNSNKKNKGSEPKFFNQERHCGAVFAKKDELEAVGGCCEKYISWGCWDSDVQRKLEGKYGILYIPGEVVHLDHPKGYFDRDKWKKDLLFQDTRRRKDVADCIEEDGGKYGRE